MSVRAYRVNKGQELADNCSFNCWHDTDILDFLAQYEIGFWDGRNSDGNGIIEITVESLEKLLNEFKWKPDEDYRRDAIAADVVWAKEHNRPYVQYDCF